MASSGDDNENARPTESEESEAEIKTGGVHIRVHLGRRVAAWNDKPCIGGVGDGRVLEHRLQVSRTLFRRVDAILHLIFSGVSGQT